MLIETEGILFGERIGSCSDPAQLLFPRFLLASNDLGRIELSYQKLLNTVFASLKIKPTREQISGLLAEYRSNFLLFVWRLPNGAVWGQWDVPKRCLPRFIKADAKRSPSPPVKEFEAFRASYVESRKLKYAGSDDLLELTDSSPETSEDCGILRNVSQDCGELQNAPESCEDLQNNSHGIGIGIGIGEGIGIGKYKDSGDEPSSPPGAHYQFRAAVNAWWRKHADKRNDAPWDGSEARKLKSLLKSHPSLDLVTFTTCLEHRALSDVVLTERPRKWLESILSYRDGPLDRFGKAKARSGEATVGMQSRPHAVEPENDPTTKEYWRWKHKEKPEAFMREAPNWAKQMVAQEVA